MSFLEGLKKVLQGKSVYESDGKITSSPLTATEETPDPLIKVYILEAESRLNGSRMETYCHIKNDSNVSILLDKIRLLGDTTEIDGNLRPGDSKQVKVFSGEAPKDTSHNDAELQFRTEAGVYYKARHDVRFKLADDYYVIVRMPYENTSQL